MTSLYRITAVALLALSLALATSRAQAQSTDLNGGFETGTFSADTNWAGGPAVTLGAAGASTTVVYPVLPTDPWLGGWAPSNLKGAYWVDSTAAYEGSKYVYVGGKDACLNVLYGNSFGFPTYYQALTPGQNYNLSFWAAGAQDTSGGVTATSQALRIELTQQNTSGGWLPTTTTNYALDPNAAWVDNAQTVIPWTHYSYTFTAAGTSGNLTISTDLNAQSAWVLDGIQLDAVPEPSGAILVAAGGVAFLARRRRRCAA